MKILFVYPEIGEQRYYPGVSSVVAYLAHAGHEISYLSIIGMPSKKDFTARIKVENPDIVAFSSTSLVFDRIVTLSGWVKENADILTICGGTHPTIEPERVISCDTIDFVCVGEGEEALGELCSRLEQRKSVTNIANIWAKEGGIIHKNPIRPLISNLDELPFQDRKITQYEQTHDFKVTKRGTFMTSRGCPYRCSYCCNIALRRLYRGAGKYVRYRSVENVVEEVELVISKFPTIEYIAFHDDILPLRISWFDKFCHIYSERISLPIEMNCRPELISVHPRMDKYLILGHKMPKKSHFKVVLFP